MNRVDAYDNAGMHARHGEIEVNIQAIEKVILSMLQEVAG